MGAGMTCACGDRVYAKGLCVRCYRRAWVAANRERFNAYHRDANRAWRARRRRKQCVRQCEVVCDAWASRYDNAGGDRVCDSPPRSHLTHVGFWTKEERWHCYTCHNRRTAPQRTIARWG